jgi:hypothetical protein
MGNILVPLAGGWAADRWGDLRMPFWIAAAAALAAVAAEEAIYRTSSRRASNRSITKSAPSSSPGLKYP